MVDTALHQILALVQQVGRESIVEKVYTNIIMLNEKLACWNNYYRTMSIEFLVGQSLASTKFCISIIIILLFITFSNM